ncbi:protein mono-ADP-ribosyltransferase TIPARP-like [Arctopsyche grandis]|uniref:protein mono-ADP-ribosyltransferase TIPARP-like n=1 Tax=Arctopsyche grandis TaxID=121162 RepID=UPI00406D9496
MGNCCSVEQEDDPNILPYIVHTGTVANHHQQRNIENRRPLTTINQQPRPVFVQRLSRIDGNDVNNRKKNVISIQKQNNYNRQPLTVNHQQPRVESNQRKNRTDVENQQNIGVCRGNGAIPKGRSNIAASRRPNSTDNQLKTTTNQNILNRPAAIVNQIPPTVNHQQPRVESNQRKNLRSVENQQNIGARRGKGATPKELTTTNQNILNRPAVIMNQIPLTFKILENFINFRSNIPANYIKSCKQKLLEIRQIKDSFMRTTQKHFNVINVQQVLNPYLTAAFMLRKKEYQIRHLNCEVEERLLFHGTKKCFVNLIAKNNFNWRLHGKSRGNIFGQGVSFSPISNYSSNYCDENVTRRYMFVSSVLICLECIGNINMNFPPAVDKVSRIFYDTSVNAKKTVVVKYRDDDFCPNYIIHFEGYAAKKDSQQ